MLQSSWRSTALQAGDGPAVESGPGAFLGALIHAARDSGAQKRQASMLQSCQLLERRAAFSKKIGLQFAGK
jgi:hypothetical protein